jgi:hypothetical protein
MRMGVRIGPWLAALTGLVVMVVGNDFAMWPLALGWLAVLTLVWLVGGAMLATCSQRIVVGLGLLPILFLLAFEGGWFFIPADLAWLAIEIADRSPRRPAADAFA